MAKDSNKDKSKTPTLTVPLVTDIINELTRKKRRTSGEYLADKVTFAIGTWTFISIQTILLIIWIILNITAYVKRWDPYPFILLNLALSFQAAYTAPIIMMSENRQEKRDRLKAQLDYDTNKKAEKEVEEIQEYLRRIEGKKLNELKMDLEEIKKKLEKIKT